MINDMTSVNMIDDLLQLSVTRMEYMLGRSSHRYTLLSCEFLSNQK